MAPEGPVKENKPEGTGTTAKKQRRKAKSSAAKPEQKPSTAQPEQKPSTAKPEQKPSTAKPEQKPSTAKAEEKSSVAKPKAKAPQKRPRDESEKDANAAPAKKQAVAKNSIVLKFPVNSVAHHIVSEAFEGVEAVRCSPAMACAYVTFKSDEALKAAVSGGAKAYQENPLKCTAEVPARFGSGRSLKEHEGIVSLGDGKDGLPHSVAKTLYPNATKTVARRGGWTVDFATAEEAEAALKAGNKTLFGDVEFKCEVAHEPEAPKKAEAKDAKNAEAPKKAEAKDAKNAEAPKGKKEDGAAKQAKGQAKPEKGGEVKQKDEAKKGSDEGKGKGKQEVQKHEGDAHKGDKKKRKHKQKPAGEKEDAPAASP